MENLQSTDAIFILHKIAMLLFGHFIGDFFFQHVMMSGKKFVKGWSGSMWCSAHVLVYTTVVALFYQDFSPTFILLVAIPHWIIDRWSLAHKLMCLMGRKDMMDSPDPKRASFGAIIYVVIDQTLHFGCLYLVLTHI